MNMDLFANGLDLNMLVDMLRRRLWIALSLFSLIITAVTSVVFFLPKVYQASALILVEGQQIPQDFVRSTVTMGIERRLQIISQEILSRSRLASLVTQFGLYEDLKKKDASEEVLAAAMRKDIGVEIKGRGAGVGRDTVAFSISYTNPDPQKAMQIANLLASYYIEENLKVREQQALGTTHFLQAELDTVKKRLEQQEQQLTQYKQQYLEELPEQVNANMTGLNVLQKKLEILQADITRARERRNVLSQMAEMDAALASLDLGNPTDAGNTQISTLKSQLATLKTRFSDKHPDVRRLKELIAALEEQEAQAGGSGAPGELDFSFAEPGPTSSPHQIEIVTIDAEIQRLTAELHKARGDMDAYQKRIENAPKHELEMQSIARDYTTTRALYDSLLKRLQEANLSDSLEQRQKAERFRLLEPAVPPQSPAAPNRKRLLLVGVVLSLGAAGGGVLLREILDPSFHQVETLKTFTKFPVIASIPRLVTEADQRQSRRRQVLGTLALAASLLALLGGSYWIAAGNQSLVRSFVSSSSGAQFRQ
jgi:succinoglycan biosynthesis transport protein ExoP